jgi:hypothetical protein
MPDSAGGFSGWLADPGKPFAGRVFIPYGRRSLVLIGANGYGKTRLLNAITAPTTPRVYARLPARLAPYLTVARSRLESGARAGSPTDLKTLFEESESAHPLGDEHQWWSDHLGLPEIRWIVQWMGDETPATLSAVAADDLLFDPLVVIRAAPRHVSDSIERWTMPDAQSTDSLDMVTEDGFRSWADDILTGCGGRYHVSANSLIAVDQAAQSVSLLSLATRFTEELATRAVARLELLIGVSVKLRCLPAERFSWQLRVDDDWIPLELASRAISRWSALTARETIKELSQYTAHVVTADNSTDLKDLLLGNLDSELLPPGAPSPFASLRSWVALDEPEVHLFASESRRLGDVLATHGRAGRTLIVTHSLDLAAQFVGNADFALFDSPGRFVIDQPKDGLSHLLQQLTRSGPGILASTKVLYVEGTWDVTLIEMLYRDLLNEHNILLSPMHGVKGANLAASSVWQRMMMTSFGMMFDALNDVEVTAQWVDLRAQVAAGNRQQVLHTLRHRIWVMKQQHRPFEEIELLHMFKAVLEGRLEDRLYLVMHGLSDIFQVMSPSVFGLPDESWQAAGYNGRPSFKEFLRTRAGIDLGQGSQCRQAMKTFQEGGHPVDTESDARVRAALQAFASHQGDQPTATGA